MLQASHVLLIWSNVTSGREREFLDWYEGAYRRELLAHESVVALQHYERHEIDVTAGMYPPVPFRYLGVCWLSIDGGQAAAPLLERIASLHDKEASVSGGATWLYYPVSEKLGRSAHEQPATLLLALANALPRCEAEFQEWYSTRHLRHALVIPEIVSGQCIRRSSFQIPGALDVGFDTVAIYELEGSV